MALYDDMEQVAARSNEAHMQSQHEQIVPLPPANDLHGRIISLAQSFSIEVLPRSAAKIKNFNTFLPVGTRVFIPFLPGAKLADAIPLTIRLRREGMEPVPHIAARRVTSQNELKEMLNRLRGEADLRQCLVIAGDPKMPEGPFADSMAVLETGVLETFGVKQIYVGGQPEGIPDIDDQAVEAALIRKNAYAGQSPADIRLISQFTLDIQAFLRWRSRLAKLGNELPVHAGIAGPTSLSGLLKFAALTGASASLRTMRRYGAKLTQLASEAAPDAFVTHLAAQSSQTASQVEALHVYTFGGFAQSANWMTALQRGEFTLNAEKDGFSVP